MREELIAALRKHQTGFGFELPLEKMEALADFYLLIQEHNPLLHLVGPASPEEFAVRHILESLVLSRFLPENSALADIGTGAGLPSVPCLIVRPDLRGFLIESKVKKARFLENVVAAFALEDRTEILNRQFEEIGRPEVSHVTCRALDKFTRKLPKILRWSKGCRFLFFGSDSLGRELEKSDVRFERKLIPESEKRFLFFGRI
ncbi:MAG: RsmG family class I SAM-dependent methyltransferase [Pyrinomonadaceae bacterium]